MREQGPPKRTWREFLCALAGRGRVIRTASLGQARPFPDASFLTLVAGVLMRGQRGLLLAKLLITGATFRGAPAGVLMRSR